MYEYTGNVIHVVDGDTLHVCLDLGFDTYRNCTVRLLGINTPEMSTPEGPVAKRVTEDWLVAQAPVGTVDTHMIPVKVRTIKDKKEKYGRYLAVIWPYDNTHTAESVSAPGSLNANLISMGWTYHG